MVVVGVEAIPQRDALRLQLAAFAGGSPRGTLLEVRHRLPNGGMGQSFAPADGLAAVIGAVDRLAVSTDVYVGVAPRTRRSGGVDSIAECWTLHADADTGAAVERLRAFAPAAAVLVQSGSGLHGYWPLRRPLGPAEAKRANRRLALALGADMGATDAARIMRPAGSLSFKFAPPRRVLCERLEIVSYSAREVVGHLPDPDQRAPQPASDHFSAGDDPLQVIPAAEFIPALTGRQVARDGKVACPFHDDRSPSLHAYGADRGWACFGCGRGGTIIDFGAHLYGIEPRGAGFHEIRRRLAADLLGRVAA